MAARDKVCIYQLTGLIFREPIVINGSWDIFTRNLLNFLQCILRLPQCTTKRSKLSGLSTDLQLLVLAVSCKLIRVIIVFNCILFFG